MHSAERCHADEIPKNLIILYIFRRQVGNETALGFLWRLLQYLQTVDVKTVDVTDEVIRAALQSAIPDFEDAVTNEAANAAGVEVTVTRNTPDFVASAILAVPPAEFWAPPLE